MTPPGFMKWGELGLELGLGLGESFQPRLK